MGDGVDALIRDGIVSFVNEHSPEQVDFVVDLCNENSYTHNPEGTNRVARMVLGCLEGIFRHHEVVEETEVGNHHILRTRLGSRAIYLLGHTDTVFPPDHQFQECKREGDWLRGPGAGDMKGGLAVIVYALKALAKVGLLDDLSLSLILGGDEEIGSVTSHSIYERERENAVACLVAECAGLEGEVVVSRNGKAGFRLDCFGEDLHVARVSDRKTSAILEIAHKIVALEALNGCYPGVTVNVGTVEGGLGPCTVPAHAACLVDLRWQDEKHREGLLKKAHRISAEVSQSGCRCEITILNHRPAMPLSSETAKMLRSLEETSKSLGIGVRTEHRRGTSDANYFGSAGIPTLDGLGPICHDDHTPNERILIPSLAARTSLVALFLAGVAQKEMAVTKDEA